MDATSGNDPAGQVYIVEDDPSVARVIEWALEAEGFSATRFADPYAPLLAIKQDAQLDVLITDLNLGTAMTGLDLARDVHRLQPRLPIILITAAPQAKSTPDVVAVLRKPFRLQELVATVRRCMAAASASPLTTPKATVRPTALVS